MKGFTLVETLVAITVIAVATVGPFYAIQVTLRGSYLARDQVIASSLAQEALEYVRSVRDNNYLQGRSWLFGLNTCMPGPCTVDAVANSNNLSSTIRPLYVSTTNLYNQQNAGSATRFTRTVTITQTNAHEAEVTVTVTWSQYGTQTVVLTDVIHDWL